MRYLITWSDHPETHSKVCDSREETVSELVKLVASDAQDIEVWGSVEFELCDTSTHYWDRGKRNVQSRLSAKIEGHSYSRRSDGTWAEDHFRGGPDDQ